MPQVQESKRDCEHAPLRQGKTCDQYTAPTLWCATCRPRLADEREIDVSHWPDWRRRDKVARYWESVREGWDA